eukprot:12891021-Prorocentrum_lima.AAC.1
MSKLAFVGLDNYLFAGGIRLPPSAAAVVVVVVVASPSTYLYALRFRVPPHTARSKKYAETHNNNNNR